MSFANKAKAHLGVYRRHHLGVIKDGEWNGDSYSHILPKEDQWLNLIETYREEIREFIIESGIRLHRGFCNLNSSQAACINLFWPLLNEGKPDLSVRALGIGPDEVQCWCFEKVFDNSDFTNFDLVLGLKSGARAFIEFKYTENKFESGENDPTHRQKLRKIYAPALCTFVAPEYLEPEKFFKNYQILRNLMYMEPARGDSVIFIIPYGNVALASKLSRILADAVYDPTARSSIKIRSHEEVVSGAMSSLQDNDHHIQKHLELYRAKYLI